MTLRRALAPPFLPHQNLDPEAGTEDGGGGPERNGRNGPMTAPLVARQVASVTNGRCACNACRSADA